MIQLLILYFLNIKSTHGYEIQRFIQLNYMEEWNSIKSGSIYYAMSQLEKKGYIVLVEKIGISEKSKKVYELTDEGRDWMQVLAHQVLSKPLTGVKSEKFLVYPIVGVLSKDEIIKGLDQHIETLDQQCERLQYWYELKKDQTHIMEKITFETMFETVASQLKWHKAFKEHLNDIVEETKKVSNYIQSTSFVD